MRPCSRGFRLSVSMNSDELLRMLNPLRAVFIAASSATSSAVVAASWLSESANGPIEFVKTLVFSTYRSIDSVA